MDFLFDSESFLVWLLYTSCGAFIMQAKYMIFIHCSSYLFMSSLAIPRPYWLAVVLGQFFKALY